MEFLTDPQIWISFFTLLLLELILGIDNVVFISILTGRLPEKQRPRARFIGLSLALLCRLALLATLSWMIGLTAPLFELFSHPFSGRDLILIVGGAFLLIKATHEIHHRLEGPEDGKHASGGAKQAVFASIILQIAVLDIVFSLDSVITAIGMVENLWVMASAIIVAIVITLYFAGAISRFIDAHPSIKMLALAFLVLIGASLIGDGFGAEIPKGYVYGPIAFSLLVEFLNIRARKLARDKPVRLRDAFHGNETANEEGEQPGKAEEKAPA